MLPNKKWKKFSKLTDKCYANMIGAVEDGSCWLQAFELLIEIVREERLVNPKFAPELEALEEATDYEYDIQGWLEDCLDEIDMRGNHKALLKMCDDLLATFGWPEYTGSDIKMRKSFVLAALGQTNESAQFCKKWIEEEPENIVAATAGVYAYIGIKAFGEAEKLVDKFIFDKTKCLDENDIMFTAASTLYQVTGKKKEKKIVDKALKDYEEYLEDYFESFDDDEDAEEFFDGELPFI